MQSTKILDHAVFTVMVETEPSFSIRHEYLCLLRVLASEYDKVLGDGIPVAEKWASAFVTEAMNANSDVSPYEWNEPLSGVTTKMQYVVASMKPVRELVTKIRETVNAPVQENITDGWLDALQTVFSDSLALHVCRNARIGEHELPMFFRVWAAIKHAKESRYLGDIADKALRAFRDTLDENCMSVRCIVGIPGVEYDAHNHVAFVVFRKDNGESLKLRAPEEWTAFLAGDFTDERNRILSAASPVAEKSMIFALEYVAKTMHETEKRYLGNMYGIV